MAKKPPPLNPEESEVNYKASPTAQLFHASPAFVRGGGVKEWRVHCPNIKSAPRMIVCFFDEDGALRRLRIRHVTQQQIRVAQRRYISIQENEKLQALVAERFAARQAAKAEEETKDGS